VRALITGVGGFVGPHLAALCTDRGAEVIGVGRRSLDAPPPGATRYVAADLGDADATRRAIADAAPDRVFHLAADASVAASWTAPRETLDHNLATTLNLLEAIRVEAPQARVLVACSGEQYGPVPEERLPVGEGELLRPQNPYAVSKAAADLLAGFYADAHGLKIVRARAFNHAGPGQSDVYVISNFARQIAQAERDGASGEARIGTGNPDARRDFTDVRDVARAYWLLLEEPRTGVFNVASGSSKPISEILDLLATQTPLEVSRHTDPQKLRAHEVTDVRGNPAKLTAVTGWRPEIPLDRTLGDALAFWRERLGVPDRA